MLFIVLVASFLVAASAQSCANDQGPCISTKVNNMDLFFCPDGMACLKNTTCCEFADIQVEGASTTTTASSTTCVDKLNPSTGVSDCPKNANLCNNSVYYSLMTDQCPKTCGRCSGSNTNTTNGGTTSCVDKTNPSTGVSDCAKNANLCNNSVYKTLMMDQCPKTCGFC